MPYVYFIEDVFVEGLHKKYINKPEEIFVEIFSSFEKLVTGSLRSDESERKKRTLF